MACMTLVVDNDENASISGAIIINRVDSAAEGAIGIAKTANKVRKTPLRVILNGLGKDAALSLIHI